MNVRIFHRSRIVRVCVFALDWKIPERQTHTDKCNATTSIFQYDSLATTPWPTTQNTLIPTKVSKEVVCVRFDSEWIGVVTHFISSFLAKIAKFRVECSHNLNFYWGKVRHGSNKQLKICQIYGYSDNF